MNKILSTFALVLCFFAFLNLDSVKGFEVNEPNNLSNEIKISNSGSEDSFKGFNFVEKFGNMSEQMAKHFDDAVNNGIEVNSFFVENKASHCSIYTLLTDKGFIKCSNDTENYWKKVDNIEKRNCCSYYGHFDCRISSAKRLCDSSGFHKFHKIEFKNVENQEKKCPNYSRESNKCKSHFPVWLIILIIFLVIGFIVVIVLFVIKMRKYFLPKTPAQH
jgi:hypothetical protein